MRSRFWRKNKTNVVFGVALTAAMAIGHQDIQRSMDTISAGRAQNAINTERLNELEIQSEFEKEQAKIAEDRYRRGCIPVVSSKNNRNLSAIIEGESVYDRTNKRPLPEGSVICDINGMTAVLKKNERGIPVATALAYTGNRELAMNRIRAIKGHNLRYFTPEKR